MIFAIFSPSEASLKNDVEKTSKKVRKTRILASQNPPKIHSKCLRHSPGPAHTAALRPQFAFEALKCDFFALQKSSYFLLPFFLEKNAKIMDFGLPKPSQNPFKMPSKSMSHKTCIFSSIFCLFWLFSALCAFSWKCLKPSKNCGFVALRAYQHCVFVGT